MKKTSILFFASICIFISFDKTAIAAEPIVVPGVGANLSVPKLVAPSLSFTKTDTGAWSGKYTPAHMSNNNYVVPQDIGTISNTDLQAGRLANIANGTSPETIGANTVNISGRSNVDNFASAVALNNYPSDSAQDIAGRQAMFTKLSRGPAPNYSAQDPITEFTRSILNNAGYLGTAGIIPNVGDKITGNKTAQNKPNPFEKVGNFFLYILSYSFWLTTILLGFLIDLSSKVIDLAFSATHLASSQTVQDGWTFARDMLNFVFILILLAISFSTIAGLETFSMRKTLPRLLFAALLVNFSLAISAAFLQVADVMTTTIANSVLPSSTGDSAGSGGKAVKCPKEKDVGCRLAVGLLNSGQIGKLYSYDNVDWLESLTGTKVGTLFTKDNTGATFKNIDTKSFKDYSLIVVKSAMSVVMIGVFAVAFIFLGILMFVRLVALIILLILAPVPYVFSLIPQAKKYADEWWSKFINYTFFLPIVTFFLALAIRILQRTDEKQTSLILQFWGEKGSDVNPFLSVGGSLVDVVFISLFIFGAVYAARTMSIFGANGALGAAKGTVLGAAKLGMAPVSLPARGAFAGGKFLGKEGLDWAGRAIGEKTRVSGLYSGIKEGWATRKAEQAARIKSGSAAQKGAYLTGGETARDKLFNAQVEEKQKEMKREDTAELKNKAKQGGAVGAAATMELLDRDDLDKEDFNEDVIRRMPKNSAGREKLIKAWKKKDPIKAIEATEPADKQAEKLASLVRKMKNDDFFKLDASDFAEILKRTAGQGIIFSQSQAKAAAESSNRDLTNVLSAEIAKMAEAKDFNPGRDAMVEWARKIGMVKK